MGRRGIKLNLNSKPNIFCCTRTDRAAPSLRLKYFHYNNLYICRTKRALKQSYL